MSEKKIISEEQLEKVNGGKTLTKEEINALLQQVEISTEVDIEFLLEVLVLSRNSLAVYGALYAAVSIKLTALGYTIKFDGVYLGEVLVLVFKK